MMSEASTQETLVNHSAPTMAVSGRPRNVSDEPLPVHEPTVLLCQQPAQPGLLLRQDLIPVNVASLAKSERVAVASR